jgi:hypothetical protein
LPNFAIADLLGDAAESSIVLRHTAAAVRQCN